MGGAGRDAVTAAAGESHTLTASAEVERFGNRRVSSQRWLSAWPAQVRQHPGCPEAVRNEWATRRIWITGPTPQDPPCHRSPSPMWEGLVRAGSSVAARIVDCNPRRPTDGRGG